MHQDNLTDATGDVDRMWSSHQLAELREAQADQLMLMILSSPEMEALGFAFPLIINRFLGSALAMDAAGYEELDDSFSSDLHSVWADSNIIEAYKETKSRINKLRVTSQKAINEVAARVAEAEQAKNALEARRDAVRLWAVMLNIIGLIVVMMKDLPVWRRPRAAHGRRE